MKKYLTLKSLGWLLTAAAVFILGNSGVSKIIGTESMKNAFDFMKLSEYMIPLGVLEVAASIGLVISKMTKYSVVLITSIMSGAVALHMSLMGGQGVIMPIMVMILSWSGYCLRAHTK